MRGKRLHLRSSPPRALITVALAATACAAVTPAARAFDPELEARNFAKTEERNRYVTLTPEFQARLTEQNVADVGEAERITAADPERNFLSNICHQRKQECAGDVRFYDWAEAGFGLMEPVLYTARNGATISGSVWAAQAGPAKRPGAVITTGSVQAPETLYWGLAATLAANGYVVLVYDVQGQGRSDTFGAEPDDQEGVPSQAGQPFYDGTEDGLDFLLSTPGAPYGPRPSCGNANGGTATDHSPKQDRRVEAGLNTAHNPFGELVDAERIGIAGHSLGAGAVSYIGQLDPRVDTIVAWDNLGAPDSPPDCPSGSAPRPDEPPITKPAIGMSNDYGLFPAPHESDPDPQSANDGFVAYHEAGVDSMQVNTRGGTHFEYSFIPGMTVHEFGLASLRGMDMAAWYTTAWLDRYVKCQSDEGCRAEAERRLLTDRWRDDARGGQIDPDGDSNLYSFYLRSRYDLSPTGGGRAVCDDMRAGCKSMGPDGHPPGYDFVVDAFTPPQGANPDGSGGGAACALPQLGSDAKDSPATLPPSSAGDAIRGRGGNDRLRGRDGDDCLFGNAGNDRLRGDRGADKLKGGSGADRLRGGAGRDRLGGGPGADRINARGGGRDRVKCGPGRDRVRAGPQDRLGAGCGNRRES